MTVFFDRELNTAATFWRVYRSDGLTFGFTSHDQDLVFAGINHRAAPGMVPTAIRKTSDLSDESAGVEGVLSHDSISANDMRAGLFDNASVEIGIVDWEDGDHHVLYSGMLGKIEDNGRDFSADLTSSKRILDYDFVPRTSPTCRATFCGPGCGLSPVQFTHHVVVGQIDHDLNRVAIDEISTQDFVDGELRFLEGPQTGIPIAILSSEGAWIVLDRPLSPELESGLKAELREGCDHTISTCASRFQNAKNFRGEPFLPGNDLLARFGRPEG